jgi:hypothetical protein
MKDILNKNSGPDRMVLIKSQSEKNHIINKFNLPEDVVNVYLSKITNISGSGRKILHDLRNDFSEGKYNTALYDDELVEMLAPYRDFVGVIMRDELSKILDLMIKEGRKKFGLVMNLDKTTDKGSHWVGLYVDLVNTKQICYFDSFGRKPHLDTLKDLKWFARRSNIPYYVKYKYNKVVSQASNSNRCGYHVYRFLVNMFKSGDFEKSTDFDKIRESEKDASNMEKKFRQFGFV